MITELFAIPLYKKECPEFLEIGRDIVKSTLDSNKMVYVDPGLKNNLAYPNPDVYDMSYNFLHLDCYKPFVDNVVSTMREFMDEWGIDPSYKVKIKNMWVNHMSGESYCSVHTHYGYTYSGTYYVSVPEGSGKVEMFNPVNDIFFQNVNHTKQTNANCSSHIASVKEGDLLIFPSWVKHGVPMCRLKTPRVCIPFDLILYKTL